MDIGDILYRYGTGAIAFLGRSKSNLSKFKEEEDVAALLYSALDLRFGIEARLNEYIGAAAKSLDRMDVCGKEYVASKLMKNLEKLSPPSDSERVHVMMFEGVVFLFKYTPVTKELASIHGRLGELLHHSFFVKNPYWAYKRKFIKNQFVSVDDYVPLIEKGIELLEYATSGDLLFSSLFTQTVSTLIDELDKNKD